MPICLQHPIQQISEQSFHELDYEIMKLVFQVHNDLGRFYDEDIYQAELFRQCNLSSLHATKEFEIRLSHKDYEQSLFSDLIIEKSTVYELKAAKALVPANRIQALNYLFTTNTQHGKLVNFRTKSVEHEFISTQLNKDKRRNFSTSEQEWSMDELPEQLRDIMIELLNDWGAFLDTDIYLNALCHFLGGKNDVLQETPIWAGNTQLGAQKIPHISEHEAFCLTSVNKNISAHKEHLDRFLNHTHLTYLHWINLNRSNIQFTSLKRESFCP